MFKENVIFYILI